MGSPTGITGDYATFLSCDSYDTGNKNALTLNGLTPGEKYQVQLWSNDSRSGALNQLVAFSAGKRVLLNRHTDAAGGPGQWVTGIFTADAVTQAITVNPYGSGEIAFNGLQVRTLPKNFATPTADARATAQEITILAKPLREQNRLELPTAPTGYRWEIMTTTPSGIIGLDGTLRRPAHNTDVAVTLRVRSETNAADAAEVTLTVPIDRPYVAPEMNEAAVRTARERYERQKYGLFVHYVPGLTADPKGGHPGIDRTRAALRRGPVRARCEGLRRGIRDLHGDAFEGTHALSERGEQTLARRPAHASPGRPSGGGQELLGRGPD